MNYGTTNQYINYSVNSQEIQVDNDNNRSLVRVWVDVWRTNTGHTTYGSGTVSVSCNGNVQSASIITSQKITSTAIRLGTWDFWVGHNNDGSKTVWIAGIIQHSKFSSNWNGYNHALTNIPRQAKITSCSDFNDEQNPSFSFSNPGNFNMECWLEPNPNGTHLAIRTVTGTSGTFTWNLTEDERKQLRQACSGKSCTIRIGLYSKNKSWASYVDKKFSITNAEPTIENVIYYDSDTSIASITKDDQLIVQGKSSFAVDIPKATAKKEATIAKYTVEFLNIKRDESTASKIVFGTLDANTDFELKVTATDSRGYTVSTTKTVKVLEYALPTISGTAKRLNNYEDLTTLHAYGSISSINEQNTMAISYQYRMQGGEYSNWIDIDNDTDIEAEFDKEYSYEIKFQLIDRFSTVTYVTLLAMGVPFAFFDVEKLSLGVNKFPDHEGVFETDSFYYLGKQLLDLIVPVGTQIYNSQKEFDPNTLYLGTEWTRIKGYVLAGINEDDADTDEHTSFNQEAGTIIGSKYLQEHKHHMAGHVFNWGRTYSNNVYAGVNVVSGNTPSNNLSTSQGNFMYTENSGNGDSQNIQPTQLTYIWERVK
jgi:hypothetical protein